MQMQIGLISRQAATRPAAGVPDRAGRHGKEAPLLEQVGWRLGRQDPDQAEPIVVAVLQSLLGCLGLVDGAQLEVALPVRIRRGLRHDHPILGVSFQPPDRFLAELAERNEIDIPTAALWTKAVCAALAGELPSGVMARIRAQVPGLVRAFFPAGERLAPPLPERAHRCQDGPPLWSAIERPVPSYLMFATGDPLTGRATEGVTLAGGRPPGRVLPEPAHVPTHGPVAGADRRLP